MSHARLSIWLAGLMMIAVGMRILSVFLPQKKPYLWLIVLLNVPSIILKIPYPAAISLLAIFPVVSIAVIVALLVIAAAQLLFGEVVTTSLHVYITASIVPLGILVLSRRVTPWVVRNLLAGKSAARRRNTLTLVSQFTDQSGIRVLVFSSYAVMLILTSILDFSTLSSAIYTQPLLSAFLTFIALDRLLSQRGWMASTIQVMLSSFGGIYEELFGLNDDRQSVSKSRCQEEDSEQSQSEPRP